MNQACHKGAASSATRANDPFGARFQEQFTYKRYRGVIQNMRKSNDNDRIVMTPVWCERYNPEYYVLCPFRKERVFKNKNSLICYLVSQPHLLDGWGCRDYICDCECLKKTLSWQGGRENDVSRNWAKRYWFHDKSGRTIDVGEFRAEAIAEMQRRKRLRRRKKAPSRGGRGNYWGKMKGSTHGHKAGGKTYGHDFHDWKTFWTIRDDEDNILYRRQPRGKHIATVRNYFDWLYAEKWTKSNNDKHRYQWEHRLREQEKHCKNRERKAVRRKGRLTGNESDSE